jgi:polyisoprenoid-binding protein YceI
MVVDDPAARAAAGPDFEGEVPQSARDGTRTNMMRPEVLDAAQHAEVTVRSTALGGTWEQPVVMADVTIRGTTRRFDVPIQLQRAGDTLETTGTFKVLQSDIGITPFSVAGGAIRVADELEVSFDIVAVR